MFERALDKLMMFFPCAVMRFDECFRRLAWVATVASVRARLVTAVLRFFEVSACAVLITLS